MQTFEALNKLLAGNDWSIDDERIAKRIRINFQGRMTLENLQKSRDLFINLDTPKRYPKLPREELNALNDILNALLSEC